MTRAPAKIPIVPTTVQCVESAKGCLIAPGEVTVKPRNEYNVIAVINATTPHARKTNGKDIKRLRLFGFR